MKPHSMYLHHLTWPEVKELLPGVKLAIIPVGSTEQHGPHGCLDYDATVSTEFSKLLAERLFPQVLVAPGIPVGVSGHHIHFPGSMTVRPETLVATIMDYAWSLRQYNIKKFMLANGHGGNSPSIAVAANRLKQEFGDEVCWATVPYDGASDVWAKHQVTEVNGHSCEIESSVMLYMRPESVRQDKLTKGDIREQIYEAHKRGKPIAHEARYFNEITRNGAMGDARAATAEIGREMVETALDRYAAYLQEFMDR